MPIVPPGAPYNGSSTNPLDARDAVRAGKAAQLASGYPVGIVPAAQQVTKENNVARVKAIQSFLVKQGYHITVDGVPGLLTKAALRDWHSGVGTRNSGHFNTSHGLLLGPPGGAVGKAGINPGWKSGTNPVDPPAPKTKPSSNAPADAFAGLGGNVGSMLNPGLAATIAGGQFNPQINDLLNQIGKLPGQTQQNKADITNWMQQVMDSLATAGKRDNAAYGAASKASTDTAQGIMASLGGSDTPASAEIGAQGVANAGLFDALKANAASGNAAMAPILKLDREGEFAKQDALQSSGLNDLRTQLASAQGQRAGAAGQLGMDITKTNNELAQQRWANKFGVVQASAAAKIAGQNNFLNALYKSAQIDKINTQNKVAQAKASAGPKPGSGTFAGQSAANLGKTGQNIVSAVQQLRGQNSNMPASSIVALVNNLIGANFPNDSLKDPAVSRWRNHVFSLLGIDPTTQSLIP